MHTTARQSAVNNPFFGVPSFGVLMQHIAVCAPLELYLNVDPCQAPALDLIRDEPL